MDRFFLSRIVEEVAPVVSGRRAARFLLSGCDLIVDFRLLGRRFLRASLDPSSPGLYISTIEKRDFKDASPQRSHPFLLQLHKHLAGWRLVRLAMHPADRISSAEFELDDLEKGKLKRWLVFALTGRTTNAYLVGEGGVMEARLAERGSLTGEPVAPDFSNAVLVAPDSGEMISSLAGSASCEDIVRRLFGDNSTFGPLLRNEFIARCRNADPIGSFRSLLSDLFQSRPKPLVYSRLPLEEIGIRPINLRTDLLLSHMELSQSEGMLRYEFGSLSEAADHYYSARSRALAFRERYESLRRRLTTEIKKREAAANAIEADRKRFGDPERLKRYGDLILSNLATAEKKSTTIKVTDYYDPALPEIEIDVAQSHTLQEAASAFYSRYQKARRALSALKLRAGTVGAQLESLKSLLKLLEGSPSGETVTRISRQADEVLGVRDRKVVQPPTSKRPNDKRLIKLGRRFVSSDGYEIVVGRTDQENDAITFRLAGSQDLWFHAADYPGSHVIVRNPRRNEVPHKTIIEAAEVAAFYSQARKEARAGVNYTQKKFVSKPPRSRPGLVRLSSFKRLLVQPRCDLDRIEERAR